MLKGFQEIIYIINIGIYFVGLVATIFLIYEFIGLRLISNLILKWQKSYLARYIYYYKFKFKYRKLSPELFKEKLIYMYRGSYILEIHIKKHLSDEEYKNEIKRKEDMRKTLNLIK